MLRNVEMRDEEDSEELETDTGHQPGGSESQQAESQAALDRETPAAGQAQHQDLNLPCRSL